MKSFWKYLLFAIYLLVFTQPAFTISFNEPILIDSRMENSFRFVYADLNGDQLKDIIVTDDYEAQFFWFERKSTQKPIYVRHNVEIPIEYGGYISLGDLDNDGDMDIVSSGIDDKQYLLWRANDGKQNPSFVTNVIDNDHFYSRKNLVIDFDKDGDMDIISSTAYKNTQSPATIRLYTNNGANPPQFSKHIVYQIANKDATIKDIEVIDFDGDGYLDIISGNSLTENADGGGEIQWLKNRGTENPSFEVIMIKDSPTIPLDIAIADLDKDGDSDIVAIFYYGEVVWLENHLPSNPGIVSHELVGLRGNHNAGIVISDPDLDEDLDIFILTLVPDYIFFLENDGNTSPNFTRKIFDQPYRPVFMVSDDLDYDGDTDLITLNRGTTNLFWYENRQIVDSNLIEISPLVGVEASGMEGGPFEPDKFQYTITNHSLTQTLEWQIETDANWLTISPSEGNVPPNSTITVDVNFNEVTTSLITGNYSAVVEFHQIDFDKTITSTNINLHIISKYFNNIIAPRSINATSTYTYNFQITDLNHNGAKEIINKSQYSYYFNWTEQTPVSSHLFSNNIIALSNPSPPESISDEFSLGDLDGDGDIDIVTFGKRDNYYFEWHENDGSNPPEFTSHILTSHRYVRNNLITDLDSDGDNDIIVAASDTAGKVYSIYWYENNGNSLPEFSEHILTSDIGIKYVSEVLASDVDADGDMDMVVRSDEPLQISWLENLGTNPVSFKLHILPSETGYSPSGMTIKDFNSDGLSEIIVSYKNNLEFGEGKIIVYENHLKDISQCWIPVIINESIISPCQLDIGDFDMDGDMDLFVLVWFRNEDKIYYIEQLGQASYSFDAVLFEEIYRPRYIRIDDIDQDGDQDIILQRLYDLCIYENIDKDPIRLISCGEPNQTDREITILLEWKTDISTAGTEINIELLKEHQFIYNLGYDSDPNGRNTIEVNLPPFETGNNYTIKIISTKNSALYDESEYFEIGFASRH